MLLLTTLGLWPLHAGLITSASPYVQVYLPNSSSFANSSPVDLFDSTLSPVSLNDYNVQATATIYGDPNTGEAPSPLTMGLVNVAIQCNSGSDCQDPLELYFDITAQYDPATFPEFGSAIPVQVDISGTVVNFNGSTGSVFPTLQYSLDYSGDSGSLTGSVATAGFGNFSTTASFDPLIVPAQNVEARGLLSLNESGNSTALGAGQELDLTLSLAAGTPEPSTIALTFGGMAGLLWGLRRLRRT